jgi:acyl dehydratase
MSRRSVRLDTVPPLAGLYARALANQASGALRGGRRGPMVLPDVEYTVAGVHADAGKLVRYQRLVGDVVRETLPSVFVHGTVFPVAMGVLAAEDFPLPLLGMLHLGNAVEHRRPIGVREELAATAWAQDLRPHPAGTQLDVVCEAAVGGETVWRGVSTYLAKGIWDGPAPERAPRERTPFEPPRLTGQWRLGAGAGRDYAAVLGDYNPIHLGVLPARVLGLKRQIAHGMFLAGKALSATAPHDAGYRWSIGFEAPVFLPATVQFGVREGDGGTIFEGWDARTGRRHFHGTVEQP